jgi:P27 family predicted phage terminase small subunit
MRGPAPKPTAWRRHEGNRGKRAWNHDEPIPPEGIPDCPPHLNEAGREEWYRLVDALVEMRVVTMVDRAVLAAYCQAYGRWVEAEEKLKETPVLIRTPSGYVQQSPWLTISNRQMELMGRYMAELGLTPASRSRIVALRDTPPPIDPVTKVEFVVVYEDKEGRRVETPMSEAFPAIGQQPTQTRGRRCDGEDDGESD